MHLFASRAVRLHVLCGVALMALIAMLGVQSATAGGQSLVISQVYGGGGNTLAPYQNDFIELHNRGTTTVFLSGLSLQYASATGTGNFGANSGQLTELSGSIAPGQYFLVHEAGGAVGSPLPANDLVPADATPINMSATGGKVALVIGNASLGCNGGSTACNATQLSAIVDLVGYGGANFAEGSPTAAPSNTTSVLRANNGCQDTDNNAADFAVGAPAPRNSANIAPCDTDAAPTVASHVPASDATGIDLDSNITITFSEPVNATGDWATVACGTSSAHTVAISGGPTTFTVDPDADFAPGETCMVTVIAAQVRDQDTDDPPDQMTANEQWSFTTATAAVRISEIQGAGHLSPYAGTAVSGVRGIVTAKRSNGYYLQDPNPDATDATSEAIFVFTSSAPTVNVGDSVRVSGLVVEFRPGGTSSTNLTITEISGPTTTVLTPPPGGNPTIAPTVIGAGGRVQPDTIIDNDSFSTFDPNQDGIDFYESLEGMHVRINDPVVVGPRNGFGELFVLADNGAAAAARTARGGIVIRDLGPEAPGDYVSGDFNPERIQLDDAAGVATPNAHVGDHFTGPATGVVDYDFGNYEVEVTTALTRVDSGLTRETTDAPAANELSVATFNVENLDANEPQSKFDALANQIVNNMRAPDVVSLEEIQDNNGATNDSVVNADQTLNKLVTAIAAAGGPTYDWRQINPVDDQDGGEPGGNIRVGFIFRTDRGLAFVDRPGGGSTVATTIVTGPDGKPQLSSSPGRVEPGNTAWNASRKPLAGEFTFRGETFFLITNHFNSKGGDNPLFGRFQPPVRTTEVQRHQQATLVHGFVDSILAVDPNANVVVLGDINDFEFSQTMSILEGGDLHALMRTLPQNERYSYVFEGNSQSLDHIVVSDGLFGSPFEYDAVHVNAEFFDQLSDHDPQVARFFVNSAPTADAGGPYTVAEGGSVALGASGSDENGDALTYAWDLNNDGSFETSGQNVTFSAASLDGPSSRTVSVRVSDGSTSTVDQATISVTNVAPTATLAAPSTVFAGFPFTISLTGADDASAADDAAGFTYAFDCGDGSGYGAFGASSSRSCPTSSVGSRTVRAKIRDKDGDVSEYTATVEVVVTFDSLCALATSYSTDPNVAAQLCHKLDQAGAAPTAGARAGLLDAFRNQVDAKVGKGLTQEQADVLKELSESL